MTEPTRVRDLTIPDDDWMNGGDNADHLTTILVINGTFHHLEAIRIIDDGASGEEVGASWEAVGSAMFNNPYDWNKVLPLTAAGLIANRRLRPV